jgi:glycosyltransferase involved in cell wall biosynthesis
MSFPVSSIFHIPRLLTKQYDKIFLYQLSPVMMTIAGIIVGKIKKIEITMYVLDLWPENLFSVMNIKNKFLRKLATNISHWHYRKADKIIVLSERMKQRILEVVSIPENKIIIIPQTCEKIYETDVHDEPLNKRFGSGFNVVFTGNISPAQSFNTIIEAAVLLKKDGINDINWIIVGDGMSRKQVEDGVKKEGLSSSFYFEGFKQIEDMPRYTGIADVLVGCLVKSELLEATIPAKVMSYIASGKPIILAMDGEVQTLVNDTIQCGFAGPAGDYNAFSSNIKRMYQATDKQRITMGKLARNYHFKHFERNIILTKMYDYIFNLSNV